MMGMGALSALDFAMVLQLQPVLDAGAWLKMHRAMNGTVDLYLYKKNQWVVSSPGGVVVKTFDSLPDAWCYFTGRVNACPMCDGAGIVPGPAVGIVCSNCGQFGKITDDALMLYRFNKERLYPGDE